MRNKNVLVTGGAGFIGSHLVDRLILENPAKIVVVDNLFLGKEENLREARDVFPGIEILHIDASSESSMRTVAAKHNIDVVFDLAVVPLPTSLTYPSWTSKVNYDIVLSLCELARNEDIGELIHLSSSESYGSLQYMPMDEKHPLGAATPYAASKAAGDLIINSYIQTFGIQATVIRPFNNYGPRQNAASYAGIIPIVINHLKNDRPIEIHGTGEQTRDYVYAPRTADLVVKAANTPATKGRTFNLATGTETSVLQMVEMMKNVYGKPDHPVIFTAPRPGDVMRHCADTTLMQELLGETAEPINEESLAQTMEWYLR